MNNQALYEDTILNTLYKTNSMSTKDLEAKFNFVDPQLANNVISNRNNSTSPIAKGWIQYDEKKQTISITKAGQQEVEARYSGKRK